MKERTVRWLHISSFFWIIPIFFIADYIGLDFIANVIIMMCVLIPTWIYTMTWGDRQNTKYRKQLESEGKYAVVLICKNCNNENYFELKKGVCLDHLNKKCSECDCIIKSQNFVRNN